MNFPHLIFSILSEPSVTDWVQSAAALFAVIFGAYTVYDIRKKSREGEANTAIVLKSLQETQAQTQLMKDGNEAQIKLINALVLAVTQQSIHGENIIELTKETRRQEIKPFISCKRRDGVTHVLHLIMTNLGGVASGISIINHENNAYPFASPSNNDIEKGGVFLIKSNQEDTRAGFGWGFDLYYSDADGNRYRQKILKGEGDIETGVPELLDPKE